jgi:signal transduction histidine kinase
MAKVGYIGDICWSGYAAMKGNLLITVLATILLIGIVGLTTYQYKANEEAFVSYFREYQFLHAHHFSGQIRNLFSSYQRLLEVDGLPSLASNVTEEIESVKRELQTLSGDMEKDFISEISFYDDKGVTVYSTNSAAIGSYQGRSPFFPWARKPENRGKMFISPDFRNEGSRAARVVPRPRGSGNGSPKGFKIFFAIPIYDHAPSEKPGHWSGGFRGVLFFTIDLRSYIINELKDDMINPAQVWIMDRDGQILFHSEYSEMVGENLPQRGEIRIRSHESLPYVKEILERGEGTIDYHAEGAPRRLLAFASLKFQDLSWIVLYSSPYESASAFVRQGLKQSLLLLAAVVFSFVVGFTYLMRNSRMKLKAEEESKHWQILMEERKKGEESLKRSAEQLQHLSSRLLTIQEEERRRISRELHDSLGGALVTLKLREALLKKSLKADQQDQIKECEKTINYIDKIMEEVQRLIRNLTPSALEHLGLSAAIRGLANDHAKRNGIEVTVDTTNIDAAFSQEAQRAIYRIFQEAFTNMEKYAQAASVSVAVREKVDQVLFSIKDDGRGFDLVKSGSQPVAKKGLGLAIMEERARILGGHFEIWSEEGKGTQISFRIPKTQRKEGESEQLPTGLG